MVDFRVFLGEALELLDGDFLEGDGEGAADALAVLVLVARKALGLPGRRPHEELAGGHDHQRLPLAVDEPELFASRLALEGFVDGPDAFGLPQRCRSSQSRAPCSPGSGLLR